MSVTELWQNRTFALSVTWIHTFLRSTLPLLLLCIFTYFIISRLRKMKVRTMGNKKRRRKQSHRSITYTLVSVIIVFVICVTPDAIMTFIGLGNTESDANFLVRACREFSDFLLSVNSGSNFILYCVFNKAFRAQFVSQFCGKCSNAKSHRHINMCKVRTLELNHSCPDRIGTRTSNTVESTFSLAETDRALSYPILL